MIGARQDTADVVRGCSSRDHDDYRNDEKSWSALLSRSSEAVTALKSAFKLLPRMSEHQLAQHWNKSVRTLQRWRTVRCGPAYFRIGQTIYYRPEDILAYEETGREHGGEG